MIILSLTVVPFFTRARVYTAYEYLERRFDVRTRSLASLLFLVGRALSLGVTLAAPAVVMSAILGWTLPATVLAICVPMIVYTMFGGVQAVAWTDVKQMFIVVVGMSAAVVDSDPRHPAATSASARRCTSPARPAACTRSTSAFDLTRDLHFWSGLIGGAVPDPVVLRLRPEPGAALPDREVDRRGAPVAADERLRQDPAAAAGPGTGVLVFVFYLFHTPPMLFNRVYDAQVRGEPACGRLRGAAAAASTRRSRRGGTPRPSATIATAFLGATRGVGDVRGAGASRVVKRATGDERYNDVNYVFPTFITTRMPIGLVGLMIAAIFAAAMSASGGELNALATATIIDFYRRHFVKDGDRRALPAGLEAGDAVLGAVRLRRRDAGGGAGLADRGREPLWLVLLRLAARRLHPRDPDQARHRARRLHRA